MTTRKKREPTAWLCCRVSVDESDRPTMGLDAQEQLLRNHAATYGFGDDDCRVVRESISGYANQEERVEILAALDAAQPGDCFFFRDHERLARDTIANEEIIRHLKSKDLKLHLGGVPFDLSSGDVRMVLKILAAIGEREGRRVVERLKAGKQVRRKTGVLCDSILACFGYRYVKAEEAADRRIEVDPEQADIVRELVRRYLDMGHGLSLLCGWLEERGVRTTRGNPWRSSPLACLFHNPALFGEFRVNGEAVYSLPENAAIISKATWQRLQETMAARRPGRFCKDRHNDNEPSKNASPDRFLLGLLHCWQCREFRGKPFHCEHDDADYLVTSLRVLRCQTCEHDACPYHGLTDTKKRTIIKRAILTGQVTTHYARMATRGHEAGRRPMYTCHWRTTRRHCSRHFSTAARPGPGLPRPRPR